VTPISLQIVPGAHSLTVRHGEVERTMSVNATAGADIVRELELAPAVAAAPLDAPVTKPRAVPASLEAPQTASVPLAGWLTLHSPFEVHVIERGEVVGTSSTSRIMLPAGPHDLQIVNGTLEFSENHRVDITRDRTTALTVSAPVVGVNINARPWAEIAIDGVVFGETPIANAMMAIGRHHLVFRHPELGERQQDVVITNKPGQRIAIDFTK
jgi:hypothetical protein